MGCLNRFRIACLTAFCLSLLLAPSVLIPFPAAEASPAVSLAEASHTFPPVYEGPTLSHSFSVYNKGTSELEIKNVSPT